MEMKVLEATWTADILEGCVVDERGRVVLQISNLPDDEFAMLAIFVAGAPEIARQLLKVVQDHQEGCQCDSCAALRRAGVYP
jgi:hypothetical protein